MQVYLGLDFGTSGARAVAIDSMAQVLHEQAVVFNSDQDARDPLVWKAALFELLGSIPRELRSHLTGIAIDGTSSTVLLCDAQGQPLLPPMMYGDQGNRVFLDQLRPIVPAEHCVLSASSSLVKLLSLHGQLEGVAAHYFLHQADWIAFLLHGQLGISDYHNSLKLGFDPAAEAYPNWFRVSVLEPLVPLLPKVLPPGTCISPVSQAVVALLELPLTCQVLAGTTDSIAAFLASGATQPGEAVTSLGSTLALKLISPQRVDCSAYGIYSHRFGSLWLAGGASNAGGAVLAHFFSAAELTRLSLQINPSCESSLHYYPLLKPGERFPTNQSDLQPQLEPRPPDNAKFLHGLLEGLARIETKGYDLLNQLGAAPLQRVWTAGGGAQNEVWRLIRQRYLKVPIYCSPYRQAAYGAALLALRGVNYAVSPSQSSNPVG